MMEFNLSHLRLLKKYFLKGIQVILQQVWTTLKGICTISGLDTFLRIFFYLTSYL